MNVITDPRCTAYHRPGHPEQPARISGTLDRLKAQSEVKIRWLAPLEASRPQLLRAHQSRLVSSVLESKEDFDGDTPWHPEIGEHALRSVGGALQALKSAQEGTLSFSLMRPPGHHATRDQAMGFCYFNSIAIAALEAAASGTQRVAVFDFDVHHGNGTEDILLNAPGTAFFSIHQYPCYPGTGKAHRAPNVFNYPVPPQTSRKDYRAVFSSALDRMKQFQPHIIGVSAGFDAYARDPLAQETLEAEDYEWLGQEIRRIGVPVFSVLEGGYSPDLPELVLAYLKGLSSKGPA